jgi:signal peptidase I
MLWRRHQPQTKAARKAEGRKEADEGVWKREYSTGSVHRGVKGVKSLLRWFTSAKVRQAGDLHKIVAKHLRAQRDILAPEPIRELEKPMAELESAIKTGADDKIFDTRMHELEEAANKWLKPYPNATYRENVEVILVAIAVAMAIRTFFLQPFKIPTGSMQPTLYGITSENLKLNPDYKKPAGMEAFKDWFRGVSYVEVVADHDCTLDVIDPPVGSSLIRLWQVLHFKDGSKKMIWLPPDYGQDSLSGRGGVYEGQSFTNGEKIVNMVIRGGDRLFVDRLSYNFRQPTRGEIIVFETRGIEDPRMPQDQYYIKRMVGMGGEELRIKDDRHLVVNGKELDASVPHFENVYSFNPDLPPRESKYELAHTRANLAPNFPTESQTFTVRPKHYVVMGDNTMNSWDSRSWGDFKQSSVIGKYCLVYWPFTERFGWSAR